MSRLRALCPAKVNLGLRVLGRRVDGYHEVETIFQSVDLWDVLEGEEGPALRLSVVAGDAPPDGSNLVLKAAKLLQARASRAAGRGAVLLLRKTIPREAGLGGGSSDAAGALVLLNEIWGLHLAPSHLVGLAAELGSDVPFFLFGGTALGTGRGERISTLAPIAERRVLLGTPSFGLSTNEVYAGWDAPLTGIKPDVTVPRPLVKLAEGNDFGLARNDLERIVFRSHPELAGFRDALLASGAETALLSGSGSTVFGLFGGGVDVASIAKRLEREFAGWTVAATRTVASGVRVVPAGS